MTTETFEEVSSFDCDQRDDSDKFDCIVHYFGGRDVEQTEEIEFVASMEVDGEMFEDAEFGDYGTVKVEGNNTRVVMNSFPPENTNCEFDKEQMYDRKLTCSRD